MPKELPRSPNLEHLKKEAKALLRAFRQGDQQAIDRIATLGLKTSPKLSDAQLLVA